MCDEQKTRIKMTHVKRFQGIPMSKSMRGLCREEDYEFLGTEEETGGAAASLEDHWRDDREERTRWRLKREQQERERLQEIEESKKRREQQWRSHVAELSATQEKMLQDRLARLRRFREFQRKVLEEESGMQGGAVSQILTRM